MSDTIWDSINPATTSGTQLAEILDDFKNAVMSGFSATSRPDQVQAGGYWIDTTNEGSPNFYWSYKVYDGVSDIEIFRINLSTGQATFAGTDSTFQIARTSADTVGPILKFLKERVLNNGQVLTGDIIGELRFIGAASDNSNPVVATLKYIAAEDQTNSASGGYFIWESTTAGQTTAAEQMRLVDSKLGIGTTPDAVVHAKGSTGIKSEQAADDANGAIVSLQKSRVAGNGSVQASDVIGHLNFRAKDSSGTFSSVARIEATATEGHTSSAKGSAMKISTIDPTTNTLASKVEIGLIVETKVRHKSLAQEYVSQNVATTATIDQLSGANRIVEFTGSTATSVRGINAGAAAKIITIHNRSSSDVTFEHENTNATGVDRFTLPDAAAIVISPDHSIEFFYCTTTTRWKLKARTSAASTGGGGLNIVLVNPATDSPKTLSSGDSGKTFVVATANGAMVFTAPAPTANIGFTIKDQDGYAHLNPMTLVQNSSETIEGVAATYVMESPFGDWQFGCDGTKTLIVGR